MWGGRFGGGPDELFRAVNDSLPIDWRLVEHDIAGSQAWVRALAGAHVLTEAEASEIARGLAAQLEHAFSLAAPPVESGAEDVHTWVEQGLVERIGTLGKKLHTGRSRNDQVATDLRLWTRATLDRLTQRVRALATALVELASEHGSIVLPGYTHLQRAQPVLLAHWCLAYVAMLERDESRLADARRRLNRCPLGCGALAGTAYAIDRHALAAELGFDGPTDNSLDAVADRDFVVETLDACVQCGLHLSKIAEEMVLFCSGEFGLLTVDDAMASGSSLMPQKKNPDALELVRAKAGVLVGIQTGFASVLKSLPLAYNKDLQEDKRALFAATDELDLCLRVMVRLIAGARFDGEAGLRAAEAGHANATDLADVLVELGVPFREAHEQVGVLVREAIARRCTLEQLEADVLHAHAPALAATPLDEFRARLSIEVGLSRRNVHGGTSRERVAEALAVARQRLGIEPSVTTIS